MTGSRTLVAAQVHAGWADMLARTLGVDLAQLEAALAGCAPDAPGARTRTGLRVDQAAAALSVLTDGRRVSVIDTPAGSGKTWVLTAAGRAWAEAGLGRVIGITPSQSARNTLAAGVPESYNTSASSSWPSRSGSAPSGNRPPACGSATGTPPCWPSTTSTPGSPAGIQSR